MCVRSELPPCAVVGTNAHVEHLEYIVTLLKEEHVDDWFPKTAASAAFCPRLEVFKIVFERVDSYTTLVRLVSRLHSSLEHVRAFELDVRKVYSNVYDIDCVDFVRYVRTKCPRVTSIAIASPSRRQSLALGVMFDDAREKDVEDTAEATCLWECEKLPRVTDCGRFFKSHQLVEFSVKKWHTNIGACHKFVLRMVHKVSTFLKVTAYVQSDCDAEMEQKKFCGCDRLANLETFGWVDMSTSGCTQRDDEPLLTHVVTRSPKLRDVCISGLPESLKHKVLGAFFAAMSDSALERLNLGGMRFLGEEEVRRLGTFLATNTTLVALEGETYASLPIKKCSHAIKFTKLHPAFAFFECTTQITRATRCGEPKQNVGLSPV